MNPIFDTDRPIRHVSRKAIYTRLEARIDYLKSFLDFNTGMLFIKKKKKKPIGLVLTVADDIEALEYGNKYIKALIPAVVNMVYKKLLEHDITARVFMTYDTSNEKPIEDFFNEESPQIKRRKMFLRWYLIKICSDPTQMEFWRYLNKVG